MGHLDVREHGTPEMLRLGVGVTRGRTTVIKEAMKMLRCSGTIAAWKEQGDQGDQGRVTGIVSHTKALKGFSEMVLLPNQACLARNSLSSVFYPHKGLSLAAMALPL